MRKITAGLFMSLDGVSGDLDKWSGPYWSEEMTQGINEGIKSSGTLLIGKDTYLQFAQMWPEQGDSNPMAALLNGAHKYVVSSTLGEDDLEWGPASLVTGDLVAQIKALREAPDRDGYDSDIQVPGSPRLVRWLLAEGLLDELALNVVPCVLGEGMRLFEDIGAKVPLELVRSHQMGNGVLGLMYHRAS